MTEYTINYGWNGSSDMTEVYICDNLYQATIRAQRLSEEAAGVWFTLEDSDGNDVEPF